MSNDNFAMTGSDADCFAAAAELISSFAVRPEIAKQVRSELDMLTCGDCGFVGMDETDGFKYCMRCGMSTAAALDTGAEWRTFSFDGKGDTSRCGMPTNPLLPNSSLSTVLIGGGNSYLKKLHRWSTMNHKEAAKFKIFMQLQNKASRHGVTAAIINQAQQYAVSICDKMVEDENVVRGKNRRGLVCATLFFAFKKVGCPRSTAEVGEILEVEESVVVFGIKYFSEIFATRQIVFDDTPTTAAQLAPRYCSQLGMSQNLTSLVAQAVSKMEQTESLVNHVVEAQVAACIWYVVKSLKLTKNMTRKQVGETCNISQVTVAKCYSKLHSDFHSETSE